MALYTRQDTNTAWNNTTSAWTPTGSFPNSTADEALFSSVLTAARTLTASTATVGKITGTNPTGTQTIGAGTGTITITPTSFSNIGIELTSAGTSALTISAPVALGSSQSWSVASGRTLTVSGVISGAFSLTKLDAGTLALATATNTFGGVGQTFTAAAGLTTVAANSSLGSASNSVVVSSGAAMQVSAAAPVQTSWSVSGAGTSTSYGALWTSGAFGSSTRVVTAKAAGTVLSFRSGAAFAGTLALDAGITSLTLNGEATGTADTQTYTMTSQSSYIGTVTLQGLDLNGSTARGVKYSIGSAANATDANTSGGGGLGANANAIIIDTTGGIHTNATTTPAFNRNYTFAARGARQSLGQFRYAANGTVSFNGTLTFSGGASDYVQLHGFNASTSIIKLNGTITGGANLDVGSNGSNGTVDATLELGSSLNSTGWPNTAALGVNYIRYGSVLANNNPITFQQAAVIIDAVSPGLIARHTSYAAVAVTGTWTFTGTNDLTLTGPSGGSADFTGAAGTWNVNGSVLTLGFNFITSGALSKGGTATLALSGNNTGFTGLNWNAGNLRLNSAGSAGTGASAAVSIASASGVLDNTSGSAVTLTQSGGITWSANIQWDGSSSLTFGAGNVTWNAARTLTFGSGGGTGTLTFAGAATTATATNNWNIGGSTAGARQRFTLGGANASLVTTNNNSVTAGYFQIQNSNGLGAAGSTTTWFVGMTTGGVATTGAALELAGTITVPSTKNGSFRGNGPNSDGALRSVSGANIWQGATLVPLVAGARFQVDAGSLTLDPAGATAYPNIAPTNANTPLSFCALSGATLNQNRQLTNTVGAVAVNDSVGASGTVVFGAANSNTGVMTTSAGTAKFTDPAGPGAGGNTFPANTTAMVATSNYRATFTGTATFGTNGSAAKARIQIGT